MMRRGAVILAIAGLLWGRPALAHPHLFIRYSVVVMPADDDSMKLHFIFTSRGIANPLLTPGAQAGDTPLLVQDMMVNLRQHPFFLYLDVDGKAVGQQVVQLTPVGNMGQDQSYSFDLTLPDNLESFGFSLYDPSYFDSVWQDGADAVTVKTGTLHCAVTVQDVGKTVWGMLQTQYVQCGGKGIKPPAHIIQKQDLIETPANAPASGLGKDFLP